MQGWPLATGRAHAVPQPSPVGFAAGRGMRRGAPKVEPQNRSTFRPVSYTHLRAHETGAYL
eukprot:1754617-Pyramimonas_sp.AAC.1